MTSERWQEVKKVLAAALERTPEERPAYLDQACSEPAMRREVESLLAAHEQAQISFLAQPAAPPKELVIGSRLGLYEILARIGAGGMGEVYQARDTKLGRIVAIKVLPPAFAGDPERLARFQREARMLASLNHPNIATIHGIEESGGMHYLVMELIPGQTLAERLSAGPLDTHEALAIARQLAVALETAHEQGVIHRDLKPANVKVTPDGRVKVLDFGLAKVLADDRGVDLSQAATLSAAQTVEGTILGTPAYMSPEQVRGKPVDKRTDIWAFGCVVYELLTARRAFRGETLPDTIAAVLGRELEWQALPLSTPPRVQELLRRCLQKDAQRRLRDLGDARIELEEASAAAAVGAAAGVGLARGPEGATAHSQNLAMPSAATYPSSASALPQPKIDSSLQIIDTRQEAAGTKRARRIILVGTTVAVAAVGVGAYFYFHRSPKLTGKDSIVLADFTNTTGEPVFDGTLRQGLSVQLEQTPFLQLVSDDQIGQTLRLMEKPPDMRLTRGVAREVCQRANATTEIEGSIAALGNQYVLGLDAINCDTGEMLAGEQVTAEGKEKVLAALTAAASELRSKLGESRTSLEKFDVPLDQATTPSLDALKAFSSGVFVTATGSAAAIPFFKHAIELDPNFALAYAFLGRMYADIREYSTAAEYTRKAYELRDRASEREKYFISTSFEIVVTGNMQKAEQSCELWAQAYPRSPDPYMLLTGIIYPVLGQYEKGVEDATEAIRLSPSGLISPIRYSNLMYNYIALNRLAEAKSTYEEALGRKLDGPFFHTGLYEIAFLQNDAAGMAQQVAWSVDKPAVEDQLLAMEANTAAYFGRLGQAREFSRRAVDSAERADKKETAATYSAVSSLREALFGNADEARRHATLAMGRSRGRDVGYGAALALAYAGDHVRAQALTDDLGGEFSETTIVQFNYLPTLRGKLAVSRGNASEAIESLRVTAPYDLSKVSVANDWAAGYPMYVRGEAYLATHQGSEAAAEFQKILDHRGIVVNEPIGALAHLGLARACAMQGDTVKARAAYQDFLTLWKDADPDVPILKQAKAEYVQLR
jgi:eukaryotic-like serine/threonine-protein kinase